MKLTIDTAATAHSIRRWLFKFFRTPQTMGRCYECGKALTYEECRYYHTTCERCEGIAFHVQQDERCAACVTPIVCKRGARCIREHARGVTVDRHQVVCTKDADDS